MLSAPDPAKRLAAVRQPTPLRSLLRVVNEGAKREPAPLSAPAPRTAPAVDFAEISRLLQLAKETLQEEHGRLIRMKERIAELRGFEQAYFKNQQEIDELRADRDMWRSQAVAMSNYLLTAEQPL